MKIAREILNIELYRRMTADDSITAILYRHFVDVSYLDYIVFGLLYMLYWSNAVTIDDGYVNRYFRK